MKTIYRSRISWGLVALIALVLLPVYALMIYLSVWIGLTLLVILTAFIVDTLSIPDTSSTIKPCGYKADSSINDNSTSTASPKSPAPPVWRALRPPR